MKAVARPGSKFAVKNFGAWATTLGLPLAMGTIRKERVAILIEGEVNMSWNLEDLKRVNATPANPQGLDPKSLVTAIMKLKQPGHVPPGVTVRATIAPTVVTCELRAGDLEAIKADPNVESIAIHQRLHSY